MLKKALLDLSLQILIFSFGAVVFMGLCNTAFFHGKSGLFFLPSYLFLGGFFLSSEPYFTKKPAFALSLVFFWSLGMIEDSITGAPLGSSSFMALFTIIALSLIMPKIYGEMKQLWVALLISSLYIVGKWSLHMILPIYMLGNLKFTGFNIADSAYFFSFLLSAAISGSLLLVYKKKS